MTISKNRRIPTTQLLSTLALGVGAAAARGLRGAAVATDTFVAKPAAHARALLGQQVTTCPNLTALQPISASLCYTLCDSHGGAPVGATAVLDDNACLQYLPESVQDMLPPGDFQCKDLFYNFGTHQFMYGQGRFFNTTKEGCISACGTNLVNYVDIGACHDLVVTPTPPPPPPPPTPPQPVTGSPSLTNNPQLCLDVLVTAGTQTVVSGETADLMPCDFSKSTQHWTLNADNTITVNGFCLDIVNGQATAGAFLDVATCDGAASQQWHAAQHQVQAGNTDLCMDVLNQQPAAYMALVLQPCNTALTWNLPTH